MTEFVAYVIHLLVPLVSKEVTTAIIQLLISLGGAGLVVQLLLLRQNRRKIAGDASASEANAASTLSGAAMKMVENAQLKEREAETRADELQNRLDSCSRELESRGWKLHYLEMWASGLEGLLRANNIAIPPRPAAIDQTGHTAPMDRDPPKA